MVDSVQVVRPHFLDGVDGGSGVAGDVTFDLFNCVYLSGLSSFFAEVLLYGFPLVSTSGAPGLALLLHVSHLLAEPAFDRLLRAPSACNGLEAESTLLERGLSSLKADFPR